MSARIQIALHRLGEKADQISKFYKLPKLGKGKNFDGINGMTELVKGRFARKAEGRRQRQQWNGADKGVPKHARVKEFGNEGRNIRRWGHWRLSKGTALIERRYRLQGERHRLRVEGGYQKEAAGSGRRLTLQD